MSSTSAPSPGWTSGEWRSAGSRRRGTAATTTSRSRRPTLGSGACGPAYCAPRRSARGASTRATQR
eukprot:2505775-Lingulodinium_polyedra.AAC.1